VHYISKEFICIVMFLIFSWRILFSHQEYTSTISFNHSYHLLSECALDSLHHFISSLLLVRRAQYLGSKSPPLEEEGTHMSPFLFGVFPLIQSYPLVA
jgi:hypothetical protein